MVTILLTIPTWNEERVLGSNVRMLHAACERLLSSYIWTIEIVDNGSTDRTRDLARSLIREFPRVQLRELQTRGKGAAIICSWLAHQNSADVFLFLDADLAADIERLPELIQPIAHKEAYVVCGVRNHPESRVQRSWIRRFFSFVYRHWQKTILHMPIEDTQCGFKAVSKSMVQDVVPLIRETRWLFDAELLAWAYRLQYAVQELPVTWIEKRDRERRSALRLWRDGWEFIFGVWRIRSRVRKKLSTEIH